MARTKEIPSEPKKSGRLKQMYEVFQMTRRNDSRAVLYIVIGFFLPIAAGVVVGLLLSGSNGFGLALWIVAGILAGLLAALIILGRRAERATYAQIEGQPGAVGAVLRSSLRRNWTGSEMPVAVNGKTHDAIYRAVGRGGVVLISEGPQGRTSRMLDDERRKVTRIIPNVPVTYLRVGPDGDSISLRTIPKKLARIKRTLTKAEVLAVSKRLSSLGSSKMPIPKGIDPARVRPQRAR
jgi:hypothetical protein